MVNKAFCEGAVIDCCDQPTIAPNSPPSSVHSSPEPVQTLPKADRTVHDLLNKVDQSTVAPSSPSKSVRSSPEQAWVLPKADRTVRDLLNKVCPTTLDTIVMRFATEVELHNANDLESAIHEIHHHVLRNPVYCKTYADMVFVLQCKEPNLKRVVINACQNEFERYRAMVGEDDRGRKERARANIQFIGELFLRNLLACKVLSQLIDSLLLSKDVLKEFDLELVLQLLSTVGHTLEQHVLGQKVLSHCRRFLTSLTELKPRLRILIQNFLELLDSNWLRKVHGANPRDLNTGRLDEDQSWETCGLKPVHLEQLKENVSRLRPSLPS